MSNQTAMNNPSVERPHFVLVPLMAQGHTIPMIDMARLLADRGVLVTFVTTPLNASRIKTIIDHVEECGQPIRFVALRFPCTEAGLPEGCENIDTLPSRDLVKNFVHATKLLQEPLVQLLQAQEPRPSCIITDNAHTWTKGVAQEFGIPRLVFHGFGCFALLCIHNISQHKILENSTDGNESYVVPGLPQRIEMTKAQTPGYFTLPNMEKFREEVREAESTADGVVVNSFDDLEPLFKEMYQNAIGKKAWTIGPLALYNKNVADMASRGNKASIDEKRCLTWLDSMRPDSVVYVNFGSVARTNLAQLIEIGLGLEACSHPFIWVIRAGDKAVEVEEWLSSGFEERTRSRGLIINGWAPQVLILSHPAVGGFVTHCGWNSTLEAVSAGVPMITWPHFAEQFVNEKLIVEVLRIGVSMGVKSPTHFGIETSEVFVKRDDVAKAVGSLMHEGEGEETRRERAKKLGEKAWKAMEGGGSSHENLTLLIDTIRHGNH